MLEYRKTAAAFGEFLDANVYKVGYLIGTRGERATLAQIEVRLADPAYEEYWPKIPYAKRWLINGVNDGAWVWADCMGWLEMFWNCGWYNKPLTRATMKYPDTSTYLMYDLVRKEGLPNGTIDTIPLDCPYPIAVGSRGHVGFYYKGFVYQSAGHASGTIRTSLNNTEHNKSWLYWYMIPFLDYQGWMPKEGDTDVLKQGDKNEFVGSWQRALMEWDAGAVPQYKDDNSFGPETVEWTNKFKVAMGMAQDGIVDTPTWAVMTDYIRVNCVDTGITQEQLDAETARADKAEADLQECKDDLAGCQNVCADQNADLEGVAVSLQTLDKVKTKYGVTPW